MYRQRYDKALELADQQATTADKVKLQKRVRSMLAFWVHQARCVFASD